MKTIELYPHNQETYDKIQTLWKTENKVAAVQATGTGKSYLILKCIYNDPEVNKVVLAPSNYILEQLINEAGEELPNTKTLTYSKLSYTSNTEIKELNIGYIFLDEFHRCGAEQWGDGVQRLLNAFPDAKVLGTSATHIRFLDNARNMGEELFNGNIVNNLSLAEAIVKKILPMPKYISALYTFEDEIYNLKTKVENSKNDEESKKEMLKEIELMKHKLNKSKGIPNILKKHLSKNYNGKFIIFCKDKIHLDEMKETVVDWFKQSKVTKQVDIYSVYSNYEYGDAEVDAFIENKNPKSAKLLFSIEMFNEGIHIEDVTGVILLRPTVSPIIYYQQIGRAMQAGKNNTPVIFDLVNNFDNIGAKNFVEDLEKEVKLKNDKLDKDDDPEDKEEKGYIDINEFMIFDETLEAMGLFSNIEEKLIDSWEGMYLKLKEFYINNPNKELNYKENTHLYYWLVNQKTKMKKDILDDIKINLLNQLDINFADINSKWDKSYDLLLEYLDNNDNCFPIKNSIYKNKKIGIWCHDLRVDYRRGDLSNEKIQKLNNIGFIWNPIRGKKDKWDFMYSLLLDYKKEFGNINVAFGFRYKSKNLGLWLSNQRRDYRVNEIIKERVDKLNYLGINWNPINNPKLTSEEDNTLSKYHIKNILIRSNMSARQLSKKLEGYPTLVYHWVSKDKPISRENVLKISEIFNIDPDLIEPQKQS